MIDTCSTCTWMVIYGDMTPSKLDFENSSRSRFMLDGWLGQLVSHVNTQVRVKVGILDKFDADVLKRPQTRSKETNGCL